MFIKQLTLKYFVGNTLFNYALYYFVRVPYFLIKGTPYFLNKAIPYYLIKSLSLKNDKGDKVNDTI